jgi:hypothetical protein
MCHLIAQFKKFNCIASRQSVGPKKLKLEYKNYKIVIFQLIKGYNFGMEKNMSNSKFELVLPLYLPSTFAFFDYQEVPFSQVSIQ